MLVLEHTQPFQTCKDCSCTTHQEMSLLLPIVKFISLVFFLTFRSNRWVLIGIFPNVTSFIVVISRIRPLFPLHILVEVLLATLLLILTIGGRPFTTLGCYGNCCHFGGRPSIFCDHYLYTNYESQWRPLGWCLYCMISTYYSQYHRLKGIFFV
jgi:hypothetical protein